MPTVFEEEKPIFLENIIETLQRELIEVGTKEGINHIKTLMISQKLDRYITIYQFLFSKM